MEDVAEYYIKKDAAVLGITEPEDGFTNEEKMIARLLFQNTVETIYAKLPTNRMRFIVAAHFELGYPQELVAKILGIGQNRVNEEIQMIRMVLNGRKFKPRLKEKVELGKIIKLLTYITNTQA